MATRLKPDWALAYNEMGMRFAYHQSRGQLPQSAALLSLAVRLDPGSGIYAANLAMAYHHLGLLHQAAAFSRRGACLRWCRCFHCCACLRWRRCSARRCVLLGCHAPQSGVSHRDVQVEVICKHALVERMRLPRDRARCLHVLACALCQQTDKHHWP